jgi:uncharacterized membrane protein YedE/YeeE
MLELLTRPWPWYVAGPLIGLTVPALLLVGGKRFGISANLRTACAIVAPGKVEFFRFDWKRAAGWNLAFALGVLIGGVLAGALYGVIGTAVAVAALSVWVIRRLELRTLGGEPIDIPPKVWGRGGTRYWAGGTLFGFGWALTGACPGPLFALLGAGVGAIALAIVSAVAGVWVYGYLRPRLPH